MAGDYRGTAAAIRRAYDWSMRSVATGVDDLPVAVGGKRLPDRLRDAVLDEFHRPVEHRRVHPAGVIRAGADDAVVGVEGRVVERTRLLVRRLDVGVAPPLADGLVHPVGPLGVGQDRLRI